MNLVLCSIWCHDYTREPARTKNRFASLIRGDGHQVDIVALTGGQFGTPTDLHWNRIER